MRADDMAWEQAEKVSHNWLLQFLRLEIKKPIAMFILKQHRGDGTDSVVIRLSQPGAVFFPKEKVVNEVAMMRFPADQTSIPVPFILHSGTKEESPLELSPFIMMDYVEHETDMYDTLNTPGCPKEERGILVPNINEDTLEFYMIDDFTWEVSRRSLSMNMNELVRLGGLPRSKIPDTTFSTTSSYLKALADLNIEHLVHQRNDAVESADDCRRKFVARQLFRKLAREKRLIVSPSEHGAFKLWCDDFRPGNVLLHENMKIAGVVDWEFAYAAPVEFSYAPPWWLLIERPEFWPNGIDDWENVFAHRLKNFLRAMRDCEDTEIQKGHLKENDRLSSHMQQSWDSRTFWIVYAALHSFAFDAIYWEKIDPMFFKAA
ncbi:hypothetical protein PENFLA_c002G09834 [Penicillium flavigenum]|uniref:Aminoglycoside phosphotransferase domain-containing protein n=1 Tax=Penicillium flavigenum TaxID=254877 RepID=A0A1V6TYW3_9EURO|nr:hypothetical protein PENFLA_c002G09834 [Penicillium flavigenum]